MPPSTSLQSVIDQVREADGGRDANIELRIAGTASRHIVVDVAFASSLPSVPPKPLPILDVPPSMVLVPLWVVQKAATQSLSLAEPQGAVAEARIIQGGHAVPTVPAIEPKTDVPVLNQNSEPAPIPGSSSQAVGRPGQYP
jgi:hypothetical protein